MEIIHPIYEWAVWAHLESKSDLELILLKGHLYLEIAMESVLIKNNVKECDKYSFYRKITLLNKVQGLCPKRLELLIKSLQGINKLRNKLAHDWEYNVDDGQLEEWSDYVFENFSGTKFSKYTKRTKIVHAFSIIARNIVESNHEKEH
jgi:hypothetical protein